MANPTARERAERACESPYLDSPEARGTIVEWVEREILAAERAAVESVLFEMHLAATKWLREREEGRW